jgi:hypothetical protein
MSAARTAAQAKFNEEETLAFMRPLSVTEGQKLLDPRSRVAVGMPAVVDGAFSVAP